jgi:hypothetical protein
MALFTFVIEFRGSTMIRQVKAASPRMALKHVTARLGGLDARSRLKLARAVAEDTPVEVEGVRNVWCFSAVVGRSLALIHFVKTVEARKISRLRVLRLKRRKTLRSG